MIWRLAVLLLVAAAIGACVTHGASTGPGAAPTLPNLEGTTWRATLIRDAAPIAGAEPRMRFEGGQAGGTTGCNTYGGAYQVDADGSFRIDSMIMTEMACDGARGNQEGAVIEILTAADAIELLADGQIRISGAKGSITFAEDPR
jgi:heat shock protein HslJ